MSRLFPTRFLSLVVLLVVPALLFAGNGTAYKALPPITSGNLTVFPVAASHTHDTSRFLTLDEGVRAGSVVVTESGSLQGLIRGPRPVRRPSAEVNKLVLVNNSNKPLLLLAGEIVTGGKQDRVIGEDRIIPANSGPVDLSVFCVEPGRWVDKSATFQYLGSQMAAPSIRRPAVATKSQQEVWDNVRQSNSAVAANVGGAVAGELSHTSSYAQVMDTREVKDKLSAITAPMERNYDAIFKELRKQNAVGVVVAVNGHIIWADIFASTDLLQAYWPKLIRSYAADALATFARGSVADTAAAQNYVNNLSGNREVVETDPDVYRRSEVTGEGFKVFSLFSLLPSTDYTVHLAKTETTTVRHDAVLIR